LKSFKKKSKKRKRPPKSWLTPCGLEPFVFPRRPDVFLKAVLEETDIRIAELKKDAYEFKRDIVVGAENFRTGKTMAEKVCVHDNFNFSAK
jgi:hypothetical protein